MVPLRKRYSGDRRGRQTDFPARYARDRISNPDPAERLRAGIPLNPPAGFTDCHGDGADRGYIDSPAMEAGGAATRFGT